MVLRDEKGRIRAGSDGINPRGRPKTGNTLAEAIRGMVKPTEMAKAVLGIAQTAPEDDSRLKAWTWLADRGWGKPVESHEISGIDGGPLDYTITIHRISAGDDSGTPKD